MTPAARFSVLDPAGPQADRIESLWSAFLWISIVVWVLVVAFGILVVTRSYLRRRREGEGDPAFVDEAQQRRLVRIVGLAAATTVLTLVVLLFVSIRAGSAIAALDQPDALPIRVTGHQWWWSVEYEPDSPKRVMTANELHVPVGRVVRLELASADVIHSFWVPSLHGKKDLIPGRLNYTSIRVDEPGVFRGQCAEFCGLEHAKMELTIVAEPQDQFEAWLAHQRDQAHPPTTAQAQRGEQIFLSKSCAMCHAIAGTRAGAHTGPDLTHVASRLTIGAGAAPETRGYLAGWILDPGSIKPGVRMPANPMSGDDLDALLVYLETLR